MDKQHGGKREGAGRPRTGKTKTVSLTLPEEIWEHAEKRKNEGVSQSHTLRTFIEAYFYLDLTHRDILAIYEALEDSEKLRNRNLEYVEEQLQAGAAPYEVPETDEDLEELSAIQDVMRKIEENYTDLLKEYGYTDKK